MALTKEVVKIIFSKAPTPKPNFEAEVRKIFEAKNWVVHATKTEKDHDLDVLLNLGGLSKNANAPAFVMIRSAFENGLPKSAFNRIKDALHTTVENLSTVTHISPRTLQRRQRFNPDESERIFRLASAFHKAVETFEDSSVARNWFQTPKIALNRLTPLQCCDTEKGAEAVEILLSQIAEGVFP